MRYLIPLFLLASCAPVHTPMTSLEAQVQTKHEDTISACHAAQQAKTEAFQRAVSTLDSRDASTLMLLQQQSDFSKTMLALALGTDYDPCAGGATIYDVQIAEVQAGANIVGKYIDGGLGLAKWVVGGLTLNAVLDSAGAATYNYALSGGSKVNTNSQNSGSFNNETAGDLSGLVNDNAGKWSLDDLEDEVQEDDEPVKSDETN